MNLIELQHALGQLRLGGMAAVLETRLRQAQTESMAPIDLISCLISDESMPSTGRAFCFRSAASNSITHSSCGAISSTNAGLVALRRRTGIPPSRFFRPI
jgi:hypothetical protein